MSWRPIYTKANLAVDHNQIVMETMKKVASRRGLACLLHEKPFQGVNGSGKHNNWSLTSDTGINMLEPGVTPHENIQFLLVLACIMKAVDVHADLLRQSAAFPETITVWEPRRRRRPLSPSLWASRSRT